MVWPPEGQKPKTLVGQLETRASELIDANALLINVSVETGGSVCIGLLILQRCEQQELFGDLHTAHFRLN